MRSLLLDQPDRSHHVYRTPILLTAVAVLASYLPSAPRCAIDTLVALRS
jgi:hypothetical protein